MHKTDRSAKKRQAPVSGGVLRLISGPLFPLPPPQSVALRTPVTYRGMAREKVMQEGILVHRKGSHPPKASTIHFSYTRPIRKKAAQVPRSCSHSPLRLRKSALDPLAARIRPLQPDILLIDTCFEPTDDLSDGFDGHHVPRRGATAPAPGVPPDDDDDDAAVAEADAALAKRPSLRLAAKDKRACLRPPVAEHRRRCRAELVQEDVGERGWLEDGPFLVSLLDIVQKDKSPNPLDSLTDQCEMSTGLPS
jgi:hypothetical protein